MRIHPEQASNFEQALHPEQGGTGFGMLGKITTLGIVVLAALKVADIAGVDFPFAKVEAKGDVTASKPRTLRVYQNVRLCVADAEVANDLQGKLYVEAEVGVGPAKYHKTVKAVDNTVHNEGIFSACAKPEHITMTASVHPTDPSQSRLDVSISEMYADRPTLTNLGKPGSVEGGPTGLAKLSGKINGAEMPGILQNLGQRLMKEGLCEPEVAPVAQQGFETYFRGLGQTLIGIPEANLESNVKVTIENQPQYEKTASNATERGQQILGPVINDFKKNKIEISVQGAKCGTGTVNVQPDRPGPGQEAVSLEEQL